VQGQTLSVTLTGSSFQSGATCTFQAGITVNSCTFNSSTQLTAGITIASNAATGASSVTVKNPDGQSSTLSSGFSVTQGTLPPPSLTGLNPTTGVQGQTLSVTLTGSNFQSGATCTFQAGITVNSCTFNSSTQLTAGITIASNAATGASSVTVKNPDGQSSSLASAFTVTQSTGGTTTINFNYSNRSSLLAAGWSFTATTAGGASRNTEQTSGPLVISYDQTAHPGSISIPVDSGSLWAGLNNSNNTLFYPLPTGWTSIRMNISSFNPTAPYQQIGLMVYQDDDNYVDLDHVYSSVISGGSGTEFWKESAQADTFVIQTPLANTNNLILRIDNTGGNTYAAYDSIDGGNTWTSLGSTTVTLTNPRLGIQVGSNGAATNPTANVSWVQILQ
jgi:hypothetical protein